jgi:hypothetical protein
MIPAETPEEARRIRISTESKELRLEFDQKYNDKLVKSL